VAHGGQDSVIARAVTLEIAADPAISSRAEISVASQDGIVVLEGSVPHGLAAERAVAAAQRTMGVRGVVERLRIQAGQRSDAAIRTDLERLLLRLQPRAALGIRFAVRDGRVVLGGSVGSRVHRELIAARAWAVPGVRELTNKLVVEPSRQRRDSDILREILGRIRCDPELEGACVTVQVARGRVTFTGEVGSFEQRRRVRALAWIAGVRIVEDAVVVRAASGARFVAAAPVRRNESD
jgi:osmotically-inducible protein OsmY